MAHSMLMELASQAEKEGISLGELLARDMTPDEIEIVQAELAGEIAEGYRSISDFMQDVEIPSIDSYLEHGPEDTLGFLLGEDTELSDAV
jgi:hypothetical protein